MLEVLPTLVLENVLFYLDVWDIIWIQSQLNIDLCKVCEGCKNNEPNQEAHLGPYGCLA